VEKLPQTPGITDIQLQINVRMRLNWIGYWNVFKSARKCAKIPV
jgi:hypothetical protein